MLYLRGSSANTVWSTRTPHTFFTERGNQNRIGAIQGGTSYRLVIFCLFQTLCWLPVRKFVLAPYIRVKALCVRVRHLCLTQARASLIAMMNKVMFSSIQAFSP